MKPIAQTFLISQPNTGIDGVFLTKVSVYFKSVSSIYGITMEIRTVDNGFPTANVIDGGRAILTPSQVSASDNASAASTFIFNNIPFLQVNTQYALVLIPDGGTDEYLVWTAEIGDIDVITNTPIYTNNQLGNLFISSNDLVFTPIVKESMKYDLYIAEFSTLSTSIYFRPVPTEFVKINSEVGLFLNNEQIWVSNSQYGNSTYYAQTVVNSNTVIVPNSAISDLTVNNWIYLLTSDRSQVNFRQVTEIVNSTAIGVSSNTTYTNTQCLFGRVKGDGALFATVSEQLQYSQYEEKELVLVGTRANTTLNLNGTESQYIFGLRSNTSAIISQVANKQYDSITPHMNHITPAQTAFSVGYLGYANDGVADASYSGALINLPNEFSDYERFLYSKSNELANVNISTNSTIYIKADLSTSNNLTAPYIDGIDTSITFTYNAPALATQLSGYYLSIDTPAGGSFAKGDIVTQDTSQAVVDFANNSYLRIISHDGAFSNTANIVCGSVTANVTSATYYDETLDNGYYGASRYISKNVILADQQDAEDLISYLTIYRPVGTQFNVYCKLLNGSDTDDFNSKDWSYMTEFDISIALFSSPINRDDLIETQFGLPTSVLIDNNSATTANTTANVTVDASSYYTANTYVYLRNNDSGAFIVREVVDVPDSTTITLSTNATFNSSNVTVGTIPNLQSQSGAFLYSENNNIVRYVTNNDIAYDSFKTFAIKIVPVSNNSVLVPIMKNMRCLALQV